MGKKRNSQNNHGNIQHNDENNSNHKTHRRKDKNFIAVNESTVLIDSI